MDGLFFLMSVVAVGMVMWWVLQNDQVPPTRPIGGLFGMLPGTQLLRRRRLRGWAVPDAAAAAKPARKRKSPF